MALPKKLRLGSSRAVQQTYRRGTTVRGDFLVIKFLKNNSGRVKIAVSIPRSVSRLAVIRNRIKRKISESIGETDLPIGGYDILITATPTIVEKSFQEINRDVKKNIKKIFVN